MHLSMFRNRIAVVTVGTVEFYRIIRVLTGSLLIDSYHDRDISVEVGGGWCHFCIYIKNAINYYKTIDFASPLVEQPY